MRGPCLMDVVGALSALGLLLAIILLGGGWAAP